MFNRVLQLTVLVMCIHARRTSSSKREGRDVEREKHGIITNVNICMVLVFVEFYQCIPLSLTLTLVQGHVAWRSWIWQHFLMVVFKQQIVSINTRPGSLQLKLQCPECHPRSCKRTLSTTVVHTYACTHTHTHTHTHTYSWCTKSNFISVRCMYTNNLTSSVPVL